MEAAAGGAAGGGMTFATPRKVGNQPRPLCQLAWHRNQIVIL